MVLHEVPSVLAQMDRNGSRFRRLLCFFLLGTSAWILVNGIYAQIPIIVAALNYDYTVISKITLCISMSSISTILWSLMADVRPGRRDGGAATSVSTSHFQNNNIGKETKWAIGFILLLGLGTSLSYSVSDAALEQTPLLVTSVCGGVVGSMSLVLYFPHAATSRIQGSDSPSTSAVGQTTAMASGTAIANLFVAILALIQFNATENGMELFSIQVFFGVVTAIFACSIAGFVGTIVVEDCSDDVPDACVELHDGAADIYNEVGKQTINDTHAGQEDASDVNPATSALEEAPGHSIQSQQVDPRVSQKREENFEPVECDSDWQSSTFLSSLRFYTRRHFQLNAGQFLLCAMTFFLPGIVPYSIQNFDNSQLALHFLTVTQLIGQTLGIVLSGFKQYRHIWLQFTVFALLWIPTVALSFVNDTSFQSTSQANSAVPITLNALLNFVYGYSSTTMFHLVHADASASAVGKSSDEGKNSHLASMVMGTWHQVGAMLGSLVAYFLVDRGVV